MLNQAQIVTTYEVCGASAEQIADAMQMELSVVKLALMQGSARYRKSLEPNSSIVTTSGEPAVLRKPFTDDEAMQIKNGILELGLRAANEGVRLKALIFCHNEQAGRNNIQRGDVSHAGVNITMVNTFMQKAREAVERGREAKVIELERNVA